jgi:Domain of unknown function (DUF6268)
MFRVSSILSFGLLLLILSAIVGTSSFAQDYRFPGDEGYKESYEEPRSSRSRELGYRSFDNDRPTEYEDRAPSSSRRRWWDFFSGPSEPRGRYSEPRERSRLRNDERRDFRYNDDSYNYRARYDDSDIPPQREAYREPSYGARDSRREVENSSLSRFRSGVAPRFLALYEPDRRDFKVEYYYSPDRSAKNGVSGGAFDTHMIRGDVNFRSFQNNDFFLNWGATYGARNYSFKDSSRVSSLDSSSLVLHQVEFRPGMGYFFHRDFAFLGQVRLGAFGNFQNNLESDSFQILGEGVFVYRIEPRLEIVAGAARSNDFEGRSVIPLVGFRYLSPSGRWHLKVTLPREAKVTYGLSNRVEAFGGLFIRGDKYRFVSDQNDSKFNIWARDTRVGGGINFTDEHSFLLGVEAGALVGNNALEFKADGSSDFSGDVSTKPYIAGNLGFSF